MPGRVVLLIATVVATLAAVPLSALAGESAGLDTGTPQAPCTTQESVDRVAANMSAAGGKPTAVGSLFLQAFETRDVAALPATFRQPSADAYSVTSHIIATDARASVARPGGGFAPASSRTERTLASRARTSGATIAYLNCDAGLTGNTSSGTALPSPRVQLAGTSGLGRRYQGRVHVVPISTRAKCIREQPRLLGTP